MASLNEMFLSIQGEGTHAGTPTCFVRFFGCNLDCSWCDQPSALTTRPGQIHYDMSPDEIAQVVCSYPIDVHCCFTGGEPTYQHAQLVEVMQAIREMDTATSVRRRMLTMETNGTIFVKEFAEEPGTFLSMSPKFTNVITNGRGEVSSHPEVMRWIRSEMRMHLKFVVEDAARFAGILKWLDYAIPEELRPKIPVYFQPEWYQRQKFTDLLKEWISPERISEVTNLGFREMKFVTQQHKELKLR